MLSRPYRLGRLLPLVMAGLALAPITARAQAPAGVPTGNRAPLGNGELNRIEKQDWHVFGKVTTLDGEPVGGAKVRAEATLESFDGRFYSVRVAAHDDNQEIGRGTVGRAVVSVGKFLERMKAKKT